MGATFIAIALTWIKSAACRMGILCRSRDYAAEAGGATASNHVPTNCE